jgi:hypothetical protein
MKLSAGTASSASAKTTIVTFLKSNGHADKKVGEVMETYDYDKFKFLALNRDPDRNNIDAIKESMIIKALPIPIIVNEHMEIIDGQHSFYARKETNRPIVYLMIEGLTIDDVPLFQTGRPWKDHDWLKLWKGRGNQHYAVYEKFRKKHKLGHWLVVGLLYGEEYPPKEDRNTIWRKGIFTIKLLDEAEDLMSKVNYVAKYLDKKLMLKNKKQVKRDFIWGLKLALQNKKFKFDVFADNITNPQAPKIQNWGDEDSFVQNIFDVYNYGLPANKQAKMS